MLNCSVRVWFVPHLVCTPFSPRSPDWCLRPQPVCVAASRSPRVSIPDTASRKPFVPNWSWGRTKMPDWANTWTKDSRCPSTHSPASSADVAQRPCRETWETLTAWHTDRRKAFPPSHAELLLEITNNQFPPPGLTGMKVKTLWIKATRVSPLAVDGRSFFWQ